MDLSKKVFGANVSKEIIKYFDDLQRGGFDVELSPLSEVETLDYQSYLGDRTPYARMWTAVNVREEVEKSFTGPSPQGGGKNFGKTYVYSINENREGSYNPNELDSLTTQMRSAFETGFGSNPISFDVNYRPQLDNNQFLKPTAGITSINSKSEGAVGALRRTTVNFIVHNKQDFDNIFLPFFLKPGATVFVDFGWSDKALSLYNPESLISVDNPSMNDFYKRVYDTTLVEKDIKKGLQTTLTGQVTKYDVTVDDKGSFSCTLEFVSSNYALLDKTVSDDNNLKFIFKNAIEEMLMNYYLNLTGISPTKDNDVELLSVSERKKLVRDFFDEETNLNKNETLGLVDLSSIKAGVFYQNLIDGANDEDRLDEKESLYMSYGLFEDLFLNNFISFWEFTDDAGELINREKSDEPFSNSFSSQNSYVRFDKDLLDLQSLKFRSSDERTSFLYPEIWDDSYNKTKPVGNKDTEDDKIKRRIPLRDLFISVPTISEAFERSTNVNDALEFIFDKIYEDSANIINIKMIQNNEAQTSITFQDVNVEADKFGADNEDILTFDLTSGNSVVLNSDLKFETPKAGLSSMIAIGNIDNLTVFDELELIKFNFLNAVSTENRKFKVQHLPFYGDLPSKLKAIDVNFDKFNFSQEQIGEMKTLIGDSPSAPKNTQDRYNTFIENRKAKIAEAKQTPSSTSNEPEGAPENPNQPTETDDGRQIFYSDSERDKRLLDAKINNFVSSNENSISPVMPITLSLKLYGNNFLGIGDFFTVNFLPKHYQDRVYFQIVGVDHSIETSMWDTTYTTVMRLKSTEKYSTKVNTKSAEKRPKTEFSKTLTDKISEESHKGTMPSLSNPLLSAMTKRIVEIDRGTNKIITKSPIVSEIPKLSVSFLQHTYNPKERSNEIEKTSVTLNGEEKGRITKEKLAISVSMPEVYSVGTLAYHVVISNLLMGDDIIDWEKVKKDNEKFKPKFAVPLNATLPIRLLKPNFIFILPRLDKNGEINKENKINYKDSILGGWDNIDKAVWEAFSDELDENEKPVDEKIKNTKQNLSTHIIKPDGQSLIFSSFVFFHSIVWRIDQENDTDFINIKISGHSDVSVLSDIHIPKKYFKQGVTAQSFIDRLRRDYVTQRENVPLDDYFDSLQRENPGFPFTGPNDPNKIIPEGNYYVTTQFGSHSSAAAARKALAAAYGFNSYNAYKSGRNTEKRKQDWLDRPAIW